MSQEQLAYLNALGINAWVTRRDTNSKLAKSALVSTITTEAPLSSIETSPILLKTDTPTELLIDWKTLHRQVQACRACDLASSRTNTVFGTGSVNADWMIIGEAPGRDENIKGLPFVGHAGQLLNAMLCAIGLEREHVFITNILKCRPPENRDPSVTEIEQCHHYLIAQIQYIQPKIILVLGRIAAQFLLDTKTPIGKLRSQVYHYHDIPLIVTYHPAYLLRRPSEKHKSWADLQLALDTLK